MSKKLILVFAVLFFLSEFSFALASDLIINEFVSDPSSGPEWIELLNTSSPSIDLSSWSWTDLASPGGETEHESSPKGLNGIVPAGGVFVFEMNRALNNASDSSEN
jgi:hypothetical protein